MKTPSEQNIAGASIQSERLAYTKKELAKALGISPVSIYRLELRGLLKPIPGLRHKLYPVEAVKRFLAA